MKQNKKKIKLDYTPTHLLLPIDIDKITVLKKNYVISKSFTKYKNNLE